MKAHLKYMVLAAATAMFAACTTDEECFNLNDPNMVRISSVYIATEQTTRMNSLEQGNAFENGDQILLVNNSRKGIKGEGVYTATTSNSITSWNITEGMVLWAGADDNSFTAYFPAVKDFTLPADQSTLNKLVSADRMTASATARKGTALDLNFTRQMAKAKFNYTFVGGITGVKSFKVVAKDSQSTEVTALSGENSYTAIITPGTYNAGDAIVKVVASTATQEFDFTVKTRTVLTIEAGKAYQFSLSIGKDVATIGNISVKEWTTVNLGDADAEGYGMSYDPSTKTITVRNFNLGGFSSWDYETINPFKQYFDQGATNIIVYGNGISPIYGKYFDASTKNLSITYNDYTALYSNDLSSPKVTEVRYPKLEKMCTGGIIGSGITGFEIPATVTEIVGNPFYYDGTDNPNMKTVTVAAGNKKFKAESNKVFDISNGKVLVFDLFANKNTNVVVPNGTTGIGNMAFYKHEQIQTVTLPSGLTSIGDQAFKSCTKLYVVEIPDGLKSIGTEAFVGSTIEDIQLPGSLTSIGNRAFSRNTKIYYDGTMAQAEQLFTKKTAYEGCKLTIICDNGTYSVTGSY